MNFANTVGSNPQFDFSLRSSINVIYCSLYPCTLALHRQHSPSGQLGNVRNDQSIPTDE